MTKAATHNTVTIATTPITLANIFRDFMTPMLAKQLLQTRKPQKAKKAQVARRPSNGRIKAHQQPPTIPPTNRTRIHQPHQPPKPRTPENMSTNPIPATQIPRLRAGPACWAFRIRKALRVLGWDQGRLRPLPQAPILEGPDRSHRDARAATPLGRRSDFS